MGSRATIIPLSPRPTIQIVISMTSAANEVTQGMGVHSPRLADRISSGQSRRVTALLGGMRVPVAKREQSLAANKTWLKRRLANSFRRTIVTQDARNKRGECVDLVIQGSPTA